MNKRETRVQNILAALKRDKSTLKNEEVIRIEKNELELVDKTITLKTALEPGERVELVTVSKNPDPVRGINDFDKGKLAAVADGGSMVIDEVKLSHAAGAVGDNPATKQYLQRLFPADIAHGLVKISQGDIVLCEINVSEFNYKGDEPNTRADQWKTLERPFTLVGGRTTKIEFFRPEGTSGAIVFIGIELQGMQTNPRRK
jgi:hypothetical protein